MVITSVIIIGAYNALGVSITKYASSANRTTVNTSKVVAIWIFFLLYPGHGKEHFEWLQLWGFLLIVAGTVVYNEIVEIPFCGFNQYTLKSIEKNSNLHSGDLLEVHWSSRSESVRNSSGYAI